MTINRRPTHAIESGEDTVRIKPVSDGDTVRVKPTSGRPTPRPVPAPAIAKPTVKLDPDAADAIHEQGILSHDAVMGNIEPIMDVARRDVAFAELGDLMDDTPKPSYGIPSGQRTKHGHTRLQKPEHLEPR